MKNKEKFAKEIVEIACNGNSISVDKNGTLVACGKLKCKECIFCSSDDCNIETRKWAESEYEEPKIQPEVKNCKVDDRILVSHDGKDWHRMHFAEYYNERDIVLAYDNGGTSWTTLSTTGWKYAKLHESE